MFSTLFEAALDVSHHFGYHGGQCSLSAGMAQSELNKKIAYSIAKHLQSQVSSGTLDEDGKEGVEGM